MADGVPPLAPGEGGGHVTDLQLATKDTDSRIASADSPYGIYLKGVHVLVADSIISLDYQNDFKLPQYPQMSGAFQTYNKVNTPFDIRIRLTKMGTVAERGAFLVEVETAAASLNIYDIVTPEKTYIGVNIEKIAHVHNAQSGASKMTIDLNLLEIRNTVNARFVSSGAAATATTTPNKPITAAAKPSGNDPTNAGTLQGQPMPPGPAITVINSLNALGNAGSFLSGLLD